MALEIIPGPLMDITLSEMLDAIYKIAVFLFGLWMYLERKNDKTHIRIDKLEKVLDEKLDDISGRLIKAESQIDSHPTHDHIGEVYDRIRDLSNEFAKQTASMAAIQATLDAVKEQMNRMDSFWRASK